VKQAVTSDLSKVVQTLEPPFFPVASAFNSIALYKMNHTTDCMYSGWDSADKPEVGNQAGNHQQANIDGLNLDTTRLEAGH
jgi:hypothetical protein